MAVPGLDELAVDVVVDEDGVAAATGVVALEDRGDDAVRDRADVDPVAVEVGQKTVAGVTRIDRD